MEGSSVVLVAKQRNSWSVPVNNLIMLKIVVRIEINVKCLWLVIVTTGLST